MLFIIYVVHCTIHLLSTTNSRLLTLICPAPTPQCKQTANVYVVLI